jgi:uncharacterized protein (TIGR02246 family)
MQTQSSLRAALPAALALFLAACAQTAAPTAPDTRAESEKELRTLETEWNRAWNTRDAAKISASWSEDATMMATNSPVIHGRAEIQKMIQGLLDTNGTIQFEADKVEIARSGDIGYTQGHYEMRLTDPKSKKTMLENGKYLTVYRKMADGSWQAIEDINNADAPAEPLKL